MFFHSKHLQRGEIATTLTLVAVVVMAAGAIIGANFTRNQDVRSLAQNSCVLTGTPSFEASSSTCIIQASAVSASLVCSVIDPTRTPGDQLILQQNSNNWGGSWNGATARVPLMPYNSRALENGKTYNVVVYDFNNPAGCLREISFTGTGGTSQTDPPPNNPPPQNQPTQCTNEGGQCVSSPNDCQGSGVQATLGLGCTGGYCCKPKASTPASVCTAFTSITTAESNCSPNGIEPVSGVTSCWKCKAAPACTNFTEQSDAMAACNNNIELVSGFTANCFKCKTAAAPTCTTSMTTTSRADQWCGNGNYEAVPGISSCYRCKIAASGCFPSMGNCSINCMGNYECKQESSSCYRCIPKTAPTATPTPAPFAGRAECQVQYKGICTTSNACGQIANAQVLSNPRGCTAPNPACCVIQAPQQTTNTSAREQLDVRPGFIYQVSTGGYVFFQNSNGEVYGVPDTIAPKTNNYVNVK